MDHGYSILMEGWARVIRVISVGYVRIDHRPSESPTKVKERFDFFFMCHSSVIT